MPSGAYFSQFHMADASPTPSAPNQRFRLHLSQRIVWTIDVLAESEDAALGYYWSNQDDLLRYSGSESEIDIEDVEVCTSDMDFYPMNVDADGRVLGSPS